MFSHPARQNNRFSYSIDTQRNRSYGFKSRYLSGMFWPSHTSLCFPHNRNIEASYYLSARIPYQSNGEWPVPGASSRKPRTPRFSLLESRSLSPERRESETTRNRLRPLASTRKSCLSAKSGCCVLYQVRQQSTRWFRVLSNVRT